MRFHTLRQRAEPVAWSDVEPTISAVGRFLDDVDRDGFGQWSKVDYDIRIAQLLIDLGELPHDPTLHDLISRLRITMVKAIRVQQALKSVRHIDNRNGGG